MNLDQYIDGLVKGAKIDSKLEDHLDEMVKKAASEVAFEEAMANATAEELAKLAGIDLPEGTCPRCAGEMAKLGSVWHCDCGIMKKAAPEEVDPGWWESQKGMGRAMRAGDTGVKRILADPELMKSRAMSSLRGAGIGAGVGAGAGAGVGAIASLLSKGRLRPASGAGVGALTGGLIGSGVGSTAGQVGADKRFLAERGITPKWGGGLGGATFSPEAEKKYLKKASMDKTAAPLTKVAQAYRVSGTAEELISKLASQGYEKFAFDLQVLAQQPGEVGDMARDLIKVGFNPIQAGRNIFQLGKHMVGSKGKQVAQTYRKARGLGPGGFGPQAPGGKGVAGSLWQTAKAHPGVATGAVGMPVAYGMGKASSERTKEAYSALVGPAALGALGGGALGGVSGAVAAPEGQRLRGALRGAGLGAVGGGALGAAGSIPGIRGMAQQAGAKGVKGFGEKAPEILSRMGKDMSFAGRMEAPARSVLTGMLAGGAAGGVAGGVAGGKSIKKTSAARVLEVGDAAGRMMAKTALFTGMVTGGVDEKSLKSKTSAIGDPQLTPEELQEAIQEAQAREDIPGRAKSWGRGGAALGGAGGALGGGALGMGASALMGGRGKLLAPLLGAAAGGAGGGMLGHRVGKAEGTEEALADRLVSLKRGENAFGAGAQRGYLAGIQRGYMAGRAAGGGMDPQ